MIKDLEKWRVEIELAEKFRNDEFGEYTQNRRTRAGYNIDYFERGFSAAVQEVDTDDFMITTLNLYHAITKNIVPALYYQNPKILCFPKKIESQDTAPVVGETLNYYYRKIDAEKINQRVIWDAYVLGYGISKIGYVTKFGMDKSDEKKQKPIRQKVLEAIGLKKKTEDEETHPEINYTITSENPYICYVSPFNFGIDPRATSLNDAMYVYEKFRKTVKYMKSNKKYKNTKDLEGNAAENVNSSNTKISQSEIEDFRFVDLYEIHYRAEDGIYILVISKDSSEWREHYHEKSIYEMDDWQYEMLEFNQHGHKLYPISDMTKIRNLQDRFNDTIDAILEQVDRFVPKIAIDSTNVTDNGKKSLRDGDIGAIIECNKDPNVVIKEIGLTQLKGDLKALSDQIIDFVTIQTGLTRAQLVGASSSNTATEATIEQGGQTLRLGDMSKSVSKYLNRQSMKLWAVVKQFVDLDILQLINGVSGINQETGLPVYSWLKSSPEKGQEMRDGEYDFEIEVGSTQKPDLAVIRKQFENLFNILARTDVIVLMQQQGKKVDLAELLRMYLALFPEMVKDIGRIIQNINNQTQGLVNPMQFQGPGGMTPGSANNALAKQQSSPTPTQGAQIGASL